MAQPSDSPSSSTLLRWASLLVVAASVGFIADYGSLGDGPTIAQVAMEYGEPLVPLGFVTMIFVLDVIAFLLFAFVALSPRRHRGHVYDKLAVPLALASVLVAGSVVAFRHHEIGLSTALIAAGVAMGGIMFARVARVSPGRHSRWLRVPFALYLGTMTLALLVAAALWLKASGLLAVIGVAPDFATFAFLAIAAGAGGFVALRYSDFVYPLVISAGAGAIFLAQRGGHPDAAAGALVVYVGMLVVAVFAAVVLARRPRRPSTSKASRRMAKLARRAKEERWYLIEASSSIMRF